MPQVIRARELYSSTVVGVILATVGRKGVSPIVAINDLFFRYLGTYRTAAIASATFRECVII